MGIINENAEAIILTALNEELATGRASGWVSLAVLREMTGLIRSDFDSAILSLSRAHRVHMIPEENQKTITSGMRAAAITVSDCTWHLVGLY